MKKIVLVGGGGHCKVIIDIINSMKEFEVVGITDAKKNIGEKILDIPIIGDDSILNELYNKGIKYAFISFGALDNREIRNHIYNKLKNIGFEIPALTHKNSIISPYSKIGDGTCVMAGAVINPGTAIGYNCIINTSCVVEHDCVIGSNTQIAPSACLAGEVKIGENCFIGMNCSIIQGINIEDNVTIGAGSVVIRDVKKDSTIAGVPAKKIK